jgi:hypothetical protein
MELCLRILPSKFGGGATGYFLEGAVESGFRAKASLECNGQNGIVLTSWV